MKARMKSLFTYITIFSILLTIIPISVLAEVPTQAELTGITSLMQKEGGHYQADYINTEATKVKSDGTPLKNIDMLYFNIVVYENYDIVVYGQRHGTKDRNGEYRYLGYDRLGNEVTNDRYINDASSSTDLKEKNWIQNDPQKDSWKLAKFNEQVDRLLYYKPIINDGKSTLYSIADILSRFANDTDTLQQYAKVMAGPTILSNGAIQLRHKTSDGKFWYDSFTIPKFDFSFTAPKCLVAAKPGTYIISETANSITVPIDVTADVSMNPPLGKTPAQIIQLSSSKPGMVRLSYEGAKEEVSISGDTATTTYNKVFDRANLKVGTNVVPITGYIDYAESIYGDKWSGIAGTNTVTIEVKSTADPYVDITATPVPESIPYPDKDAPVKINVNASLVGYTDLTNIKSVTIYAKFSDAPANEFQFKTLPIATTGSASFDFVIPKTLIDEGLTEQEFTATAIFAYKTNVNNKPDTKGSTTCSVFINPPIIPSHPPVPRIIAPKEVKAGEDFDIDGSESYDEDGFIMEYLWSLPGTDFDGLTSDRDTIWYPEEGNYRIGLKVTDDGGLTGSTTKNITVKPATPEAKIRLLGTLKENRKITLDASTSTSPTHYPIVWPSTIWGLAQVSGNSVADIKYSGILNGNMKKDIIVKRAGTDRVDLRVINEKNLSNSTSSNMTIIPDKPPIADFSTVTTVMRDPLDTNYSKITINDTSYSTDSDYIKNVIVTFSYDSDNNGAFNNGSISINAADYINGEMKVIATPWGFSVPVTVSKPAGKPVHIDIRTKHVGKYYADLKAVEGFGQETIPEFITEADYRFDDTTDKPNIEKTIEVINLAPTAGFNITNKRKADIVVALPYNYTQDDVNSQINSKVIPGLVANNMDYRIRYVPYEAYKPQPVDNYAYWVVKDRLSNSSNRGIQLWQYNYATGVATEKDITSLPTLHEDGDIFVTDNNQVYLVYQSSTYLGDGKSAGVWLIARYDGNDGMKRYGIFSNLDDVENHRSSGPLINVMVNDEGTLYYTYKDVTYGYKVGGSKYVVTDPIELNGALSYAAQSNKAPIGYTYSTDTVWEVPPGYNRDYAFWRVFSNRDGIKTMIGKDRRSWDKDADDGNGDYREDIYFPAYYPTPTLNTLDKVFKSVVWNDSYEKYFVVLSSEASTELQRDTVINNIVLKSAPQNISLVMLGNSKNKTEFENLIARNDGNGLFYDITNLGAAIGKLGDFILNRINVDLVFNYNHLASTLAIVQSKVNTLLKPKLAAANIASKITYISGIADMNTALDKIAWNPLNDHMFIHMQDTTIAELNESLKKADILDTLRGAEADIIGLGSSANASQFNSLLGLYDNEGAFFDTANIDTAINNLGNYIVANAKRKSPNIYKYVILGEEVDYNTTYQDVENDPIYAERWKYVHDERYYENNLGRIADSGVYRSNPYTIFNKTGKYTLTYAARDNPKNNNLFDNYRLWSNEELSRATVFVHRRPIASYLWSMIQNTATGKYNVIATSTSEDADHTSRADKGIVQEQWRWKALNEDDWQPGTPTEISIGVTYILELRVQDMEGAWSESYTELITVPQWIIDAIPPFRDWGNTDVTVNVKATKIGTTTAYLKQVDYMWTQNKVKPATGWLSNASSNFNITKIENGEWYLHLVAVPSYGSTYYTVKGPYRIDKIPPVITADKNFAPESSEPVTVNVTVTDAGGSGIKDVQHAWSKSTTKPTSGWAVTSGNFSTTQEDSGIWYLHVQATDNAGNVTYGRLGTYTVNSYKLENFRVVMVRDVHLEPFYRNPSRTLGSNFYVDKPMYANNLAVDATNFGSMVDGLTKGYRFEFEIDSTNFNEDLDTIVIVPHFYTGDAFARDVGEKDLYWENSYHEVYKAGEGGHSAWRTITLKKNDRTIKNTSQATWRGEYLIPATAWAVPLGTTEAQAKSKDLKRDIIVNFEIKGYKAGVMKYDYNLLQWGLERTIPKYPYQIGDVIKYSWKKSLFDDRNVKDNR